jgi:hypothetical protein
MCNKCTVKTARVSGSFGTLCFHFPSSLNGRTMYGWFSVLCPVKRTLVFYGLLFFHVISQTALSSEKSC